MRNATLAYEVLDYIDANPQLWEQTSWYKETECGTTGCFAGWGVLLAGGKGMSDQTALLPDGTRHFFPDAADIVLGIEDVNHYMYDAALTREELGVAVAEVFGPRPPAIRTEDEMRRGDLVLVGSR